MPILNSIVEFLAKLVQWWFVVMPWEQAIHIRRGKKVMLRNEGLYFKIPFVDQVFKQTTRMRTIETGMQTVTSRDGVAITVKAFAGYEITDLYKLYKTLYHPELTISSMINGIISDRIRSFDANNINPTKIELEIVKEINTSGYGISNVGVKITTFAMVKTIRLIQDNSFQYGELDMEAIK